MPREARDSPKDRRAIAIRDAAREIEAREGVWDEIGIPGGKRMKVLSAKFENVHILYMTPFQPLPDMPDAMKYLAAILGFKDNRGYGIDIWVDGRKVFFVEWAGDDDLLIASFHRGAWEEQVLRRAAT
jgi:hypothetical protein